MCDRLLSAIFFYIPDFILLYFVIARLSKISQPNGSRNEDSRSATQLLSSIPLTDEALDKLSRALGHVQRSFPLVLSPRPPPPAPPPPPPPWLECYVHCHRSRTKGVFLAQKPFEALVDRALLLRPCLATHRPQRGPTVFSISLSEASGWPPSLRVVAGNRATVIIRRARREQGRGDDEEESAPRRNTVSREIYEDGKPKALPPDKKPS